MKLEKPDIAFKRKAAKAAKILKTLAHKERLLILCHLLAGEQSAGNLCKQSQLSQSAFSQHLAILRREKLVKTRKESQSVFYSLTNNNSIEILKTLQKLYCSH